MRSRPPAPSSAAAHGFVNWFRPNIVLATRNSMTLTPLMQVLLALGYYATGSCCLVIGVTPGVSKDASTREVYRASKALCAMGVLGRGLVLFPTSDAKGVSTMLLPHIRYRITHMLFSKLYAAKNAHRCQSGMIL